MVVVRYLFLCTFLFLLGCSDDISNEEYRTLEVVKEYTVSQWGGQTARTLCASGDTLFVVTADSFGVTALRIMHAQTGSSLGVIASWFNGTDTVTFTEVGTAVTATKEKIYVGTKASRVEVFNRQTLAWETTVGTGVWWGNDTFAMVHSFGIVQSDSLLFVRDKSNLRVYALADITTANKNKVPLFSKSIALSTSTAHHGVAVTKNKVYVTDYGLKALLVFSRASFTQGNYTLTPEDTITLSFRPLGVTTHRNELFISGENGSFECWSQDEQSLIRRYPSIEGHTFLSPGAISLVDSQLTFVEQTSGSVFLGILLYHPITIYN